MNITVTFRLNKSKSRALITCTVRQWKFHDAKYTVSEGPVNTDYLSRDDIYIAKLRVYEYITL